MDIKLLRKIFFSTFYLSAFTFGGGYVIITLFENKFVKELKWITQEEMLDMTSIAQSAPGPIAVNGAVVVGYKLGGIPGVISAVLGASLPPFIILTIISFFYEAFKENPLVESVLYGMNSGIGAVIASVVYDMGSGVAKSKSPLLIFIMVISFIADYIIGINVVYIILTIIAIGVIRTVLRQRRSGN